MTPQTVNKAKWFEKPIILVMISFALGVSANSVTNYITYANKVDKLTSQVEEMNITINKINNTIEARQQRWASVNSRLTALEVKVFGQPFQGSQAVYKKYLPEVFLQSL